MDERTEVRTVRLSSGRYTVKLTPLEADAWDARTRARGAWYAFYCFKKEQRIAVPR